MWEREGSEDCHSAHSCGGLGCCGQIGSNGVAASGKMAAADSARGRRERSMDCHGFPASGLWNLYGGDGMIVFSGMEWLEMGYEGSSVMVIGLVRVTKSPNTY
ncbi:hypothetical protein M0R45_035993 [Rubus argutus]|uniref:Uncharacterized protein n=1 Tax=Rubus argutus TaxID=59490 RepID=A0AAW1VXB3_RUBAR